VSEIRDEAYWLAYGHYLEGDVDKLNGTDGIWPDRAYTPGDIIACPKCAVVAEEFRVDYIRWKQDTPQEMHRDAGLHARVLTLGPCGHRFAEYPKVTPAPP